MESFGIFALFMLCVWAFIDEIDALADEYDKGEKERRERRDDERREREREIAEDFTEPRDTSFHDSFRDSYGYRDRI